MSKKQRQRARFAKRSIKQVTENACESTFGSFESRSFDFQFDPTSTGLETNAPTFNQPEMADTGCANLNHCNTVKE